MSNEDRWQKVTRPSGQPAARRSLEPADPLPAWKAVVQVAILLGIPLTLLLIARVILTVYFPELGY